MSFDISDEEYNFLAYGEDFEEGVEVDGFQNPVFLYDYSEDENEIDDALNELADIIEHYNL